RRSVVMQSTTIIAFDQHAATTVAAVLLPNHRTPALHSLTSDSSTIVRFVERFRRQGAVACCYEAGPCGFELQRALTARDIPCAVEEDLQGLLDLEPLRPRIERLRCFRGMNDLTALTIAAELGDARRFASAPRAMAFVGLVPSEHSSGPKQARGAITKTGNTH